MDKRRGLPIIPLRERHVPDPVTGQHWECRIAARRLAADGYADVDRDEGWVERISCRHEGMETELDLPLGDLARLADHELLGRIVHRIA